MTDKDSLKEGNPSSTSFTFSAQTSRPTSLLVLLAGLMIIGTGAVVYLLLLPSNPNGDLVGRYSLSRLILVSGPLLLIISSGAIMMKTIRDSVWTSRIADSVIGNERNVRRLAITGFSVSLSIFAIVVTVRPAWLSSLNAFHVQRLAPYFVLPMISLGLLWAATQLAHGGIQCRLSSRTTDVLIGVTLFLVSFAARYPITGYALPYAGMWDEVVTYTPALAILRGDDVVYKPISLYRQAGYGELLVHLTAAADVVGFLDGMRTQRVDSLEEFVSPAQGVETIAEGVHSSGIPLQYPRILFALVGSFAPALVYLGLRRHLRADRGPAVVGGLLLALGSSAVIVRSASILPDPLAMTISIGIVLCGMEVIQDQQGLIRWHALSGFLVGLACGAVLRYAVLISIPIIAFALAANRTRPFVKLGALGLGLIIGFVVSSPGFFIHTSRELIRLTSNTWLHDLSLTHRVESTVYYSETLVEGVGVIAVAVALVGAIDLLSRRTRTALLLLLFSAVYLWWLSPIQARYTRHTLVLYPIISLLVGSGVQAITQILKTWKWRLRSSDNRQGSIGSRGISRISASASWFVPVLFLVTLSPRISENVDTVSEMARYETPQQKMTEFLDAELGPEDIVGILALLPFSEKELTSRGIAYERIPKEDSIADLRAKGITLAVGTNRVFGEYGDVSGTIWETEFSEPTSRIAAFGSRELQHRARPNPDVYLFAVRIDPEEG